MSLRSEVIRTYNQLIAGAKKISELPAAGALTGTELIETVQGGANVQTTTQAIANLGGGGGGGWATTGTTLLTGDVIIDGNTNNLTFTNITAFHVNSASEIHLISSGDNNLVGINSMVEGTSSALLKSDNLATIQVGGVNAIQVTPTTTTILNGVLTGTPTAPTALLTVSTTQIATTAFVTGIMQFVTPEMYGAVGDGATDDSTAINNAIASGKAVYFGSKNYRIATTLTTTDDTRLFGDGVNSIISVATNIAVITIGGINGTIENLQILGSGSGAAQNGITAVGNAGFTLYRYNTRVYNVFFNDLGNAGMYTTYTIGADTGSEHQGTYYAVNCRATSCAVGYFMDTRGEYNTFSNCLADNCPIGVRFNGGNNSWTGGNIVDCTTGVYIGSGTNDGHGVITGAKINHTNITCSSTATGYAFVGCEIVACSITLTSCTDIRFYSCDIASSPITSTNAVGTVFHSNCFRTTPTITIAAGNNPTFVANTFPAASTVHSLIVNTFQGGIQNTQQGPTSPNIFTSTWTTTASGQYTTLFTGTITPRATASDVTSGVVIDLDYTATANSQVYNQVSIVGTLATGGFSSTELNSLSVSGRTKFKDVATTGATGVLELQDSAGATIAKWSADGIYRIGNAGSPAQLTTTSDGIVLNKSGNGLLFSMGAIGANFTATASGGGTSNAHAIRAGGGSTTSSAALPWTALLIDPTYNQSGTATGNVLGIDYNPTVTAVLGIHYGILVRPSCISGFAAGGTPADAYVVIGAGTTALAPFKLTSGTNLTTAVAGCMEYDGTNLFFTRTGTTRESVICSNAVNAVSPTAPDRTITVVIAGTTYYLHAKTTND